MSPRQPPLPSIQGLTQEELQPAPGLQTLLMLLNAHHLFSIHPINFPVHSFSPSARRHRATAHLYANYFATWTKVIMLSDRKLTGLKSEMEINKLTPLNDGETGMRAALCLGTRAASIRRRQPGGPGYQSCPGCVHQALVPWETTSLPQNKRSIELTYPVSVSGCILPATQTHPLLNPNPGGTSSFI